MYPISKLITDSLKANHLRLPALVKKLGYTNINRGIRRLNSCLEEGNVNEFLLNKIITELGIDPNHARAAVQETRLMKKRERLEIRQSKEQRERENFKPHLFALSAAQRPFSICAYAMFGGDARRTILLPEDITHKPFQEQMRIIRIRVNEYRLNNNDRVLFLGPLSGFLYRYAFRQSLQLTIEGHPLNESNESGANVQCYAEFKNKIIRFPYIETKN